MTDKGYNPSNSYGLSSDTPYDKYPLSDLYQSNILYIMITVRFTIRSQGVNLVDYIYYIIILYSIY